MNGLNALDALKSWCWLLVSWLPLIMTQKSSHTLRGENPSDSDSLVPYEGGWKCNPGLTPS